MYYSLITNYLLTIRIEGHNRQLGVTVNYLTYMKVKTKTLSLVLTILYRVKTVVYKVGLLGYHQEVDQVQVRKVLLVVEQVLRIRIGVMSVRPSIVQYPPTTRLNRGLLWTRPKDWLTRLMG